MHLFLPTLHPIKRMRLLNESRASSFKSGPPSVTERGPSSVSRGPFSSVPYPSSRESDVYAWRLKMGVYIDPPLALDPSSCKWRGRMYIYPVLFPSSKSFSGEGRLKLDSFTAFRARVFCRVFYLALGVLQFCFFLYWLSRIFIKYVVVMLKQLVFM